MRLFYTASLWILLYPLSAQIELGAPPSCFDPVGSFACFAAPLQERTGSVGAPTSYLKAGCAQAYANDFWANPMAWALETCWRASTRSSLATGLPTPGTLLSRFSVQVHPGKGNHLTWTTTRQPAANTFIVQAATVRGEFRNVGTVAVREQGSSPARYAFTDPAPLAPVMQYRIWQTGGNNGNDHFGPIVIIDAEDPSLRRYREASTLASLGGQ